MFILLCLHEEALKDTLEIKKVVTCGRSGLLRVGVSPLNAYPFISLFKLSENIAWKYLK